MLGYTTKYLFLYFKTRISLQNDILYMFLLMLKLKLRDNDDFQVFLFPYKSNLMILSQVFCNENEKGCVVFLMSRRFEYISKVKTH